MIIHNHNPSSSIFNLYFIHIVSAVPKAILTHLVAFGEITTLVKVWTNSLNFLNDGLYGVIGTSHKPICFCSMSSWQYLFRHILQKKLWPSRNRRIYSIVRWRDTSILYCTQVNSIQLNSIHVTTGYPRTNLGVSQQCGWILVFLFEKNFTHCFILYWFSPTLPYYVFLCRFMTYNCNRSYFSSWL